MRFDQLYLGAAHGSVDIDAREAEAGVTNCGSKGIERLEKMDIGIPERIVGVENEIQRFSH